MMKLMLGCLSFGGLWPLLRQGLRQKEENAAKQHQLIHEQQSNSQLVE